MGIRAVMFMVGAAVGFCVIWYYVALLGLFGDGSYPVGPVVAAFCAIGVGIVSARFVRSVAIFGVSTVIGYLLVVSGWLAYADVFGIGDREGGKGMAIIFIFGPAAGAVIGLIAAGFLSRRGLSDGNPAAIAGEVTPRLR
jgi:hypothetical protein